MNKLYLLLVLAICSISMQAQYQKLNMPLGNISNSANQTTFSPKTLNFTSENPISHDGLRAISRDNNQAILIKGTPLTQGRSGNGLWDVAKDYLFSAAPIMGIKNTDEEMLLIKTDVDELGMHHIKYQQVYNQIPVYGAEVILHGKSGNIDMLMGRYEQTPTIDTEPTLSIVAAKLVVANHIGQITMPQNDIYNLFDIDPITAELVIYKGQLAYHSTTYSNLIDRREIFTDAHTGAIINEYKSICTFHNHSSENAANNCTHSHETTPSIMEANTAAPMGDEITNAIDLLGISRTIHTYEEGGTYYMMDISKPDMFNASSNLPDEPEGVIWTINAFNTSPEGNNFNYDHFTSVNNTWATSPEAISSQFNGNLAYQYFLDRHARVSINGQAGNIVSFVNVSDKQGNSMDNAFWNGFAMFYGNGSQAFKPLARGLDVAGHEMTHGVVQNTANLEYYGESGALNESFADVFGAMIDRDNWLIGEDVVVNTSAFPSGALRSLINPNQNQPNNSFNTGWQPMHVNQQFTGQEDNNGVHINSGIPNHAFYQFANAVGKDKAEDVYYRALDKYLTKSSQFIDARIAVIQAAQDLNLSSNEVQAARNAFDAVGITDGNSTTTPTDIEVNPGEDIIVYATEDLQSLSLMRPDGTMIAEGIAPVGIRSKITVTDNGSAIVFVNSDNQAHVVLPDWTTSTPTFQHGVLNFSNNANIRSIAVSRQGNRIAITRTELDNQIDIFDYPTNQWYGYELYNPTFSQDGERTYNVAFADAMEFDYSSNYIMYDALNQIEGQLGVIEYYDIGFLNIWNESENSPSLGNISKLFSGLPDNVSIGNPTFSKNSEFIIAFDYAENVVINGNNQFENFRIYGANIETGDNGIIANNTTFGYPSYSTLDNAIVYTKEFEPENPNNDLYDIAGFNLDATKIQPTGDEVILTIEGRFATWFSNGERDLVEVIETPEGKTVEMTISPNPASLETTLTFSGDFQGDALYTITDITGKVISSDKTYIHLGEQTINLPIGQLASGLYNVTLRVGDQSATTRLVKQ